MYLCVQNAVCAVSMAKLSSIVLCFTNTHISFAFHLHYEFQLEKKHIHQAVRPITVSPGVVKNVSLAISARIMHIFNETDTA